MKTVGDVLRQERLFKNISLDKLSSLTKIDTKYIQAIENNRLDLLPSATFAKGFVRNIAIVLEKDPADMVALFRRDYQETFKPSVLVKRTRPFKLNHFLSSQILLWSLGAIAFVGYLIFQYRAVLTPPVLEVSSPTENAVLSSPILIEGKTTTDAVININDGLKILPDSTGRFATKITLQPGESTLKITSTSRFGRSSSISLPLTILSQ